MKLKDFEDAKRTLGRKRQEIEEARTSRITYKELLDASESFQEDPFAESDAWISARRFVDWANFHNLPTKEIKRRVICFLNRWHCRLPKTDDLAEELKETYRQMMPFLKALENETIEDFEFEQKKEVNDKEYSNKEIMHEIFRNFSRIRHNFRGVATSKLLSLINPYLFVMWDNPICKAYGIRSSSDPDIRDQQYVPEFFLLMKEKANSVIDSYIREKKCSREEAIKAINNLKEWRPLAKLLDEYNWTMYSQQ